METKKLFLQKSVAPKVLLVVFILLLSVGAPLYLTFGIVNGLTIYSTSSTAINDINNQLQPRIERINGIATQFGPISNFLRFDYQRDGVVYGKIQVDNQFVDNVIGKTSGLLDISQCLPPPSTSLQITQFHNEISQLQSQLSQSCVNKSLGITAQGIHANFNIVQYPGMKIYPDFVSKIFIAIIVFVLINTMILLIVSVWKGVIELINGR